MSQFVSKRFVFPPGPSARVIVFTTTTHGLAEYAKQQGIRNTQNRAETAVSLALIAYGQHPDEHEHDGDVRRTLRDILGATLASAAAGEKVSERIARFRAPGNVRSIRGLMEWYLNGRFPLTDADSLARMSISSDEYDSSDGAGRTAGRSDGRAQLSGKRKRSAKSNDEGDNGETEHNSNITDGDKDGDGKTDGDAKRQRLT
ncbi:hypothetical protein F5Y19DRAFT_480772 [Xylariaceae sp. FL1651]|nr:hypothetical protein F5Y19DRAFT_480772 [Xylariaceae sp. FL1651]